MKSKRWAILLASLGVVLLAWSVGVISGAFTDEEKSTGNELITSNWWLQTIQFDFDAGVSNDAYISPDDVSLAAISGWYNAFWSRRAPVTVNNIGSNLSDYQVIVNVTYDADMQSDFDDIRFTASDGVTSLSYWMDSYIADTSAVFWVNVTSAPAGDSTIYMYYGNSGVSSTSNGTNTFIFFDDFEVDLSKWTEISPGNGAATRVTTPGAPHGNYSVEITGNKKYGIQADFSAQTLCVIEYYMSVAQSNEEFNIEVRNNPRAAGPVMRFEKKGTLQHKDIAGWQDITAYTVDTWYKFRLDAVNCASDTYDIYIDDTLEVSGASFSKVIPDVSQICFFGPKRKAATSHVDLVKVRKYADPVPTTSVGSEENVSYVSSGTLASQVYDSGTNGTGWYELNWSETLPASTDITFEVRANDTSFNKSDVTPAWTDLGSADSPVNLTPYSITGRYFQWLANLLTGDTAVTPILHNVTVYYPST